MSVLAAVVAVIALVQPGSGHQPAQTARPYEDLVCSYSWPCDQAMRVMLCESHGDPNAYAGGNRGLFQISYVHAGRVGGDLDALYDPETNVRVAHELYVSAGGWGPWAYCGRL